MYQQQPLRSAGSALQRLPQQWLHSGCICRRFKQQQNSAHAAINCTLKLQHEHQAHGLQVSWRLQARQHWRATAAAAAGAATTSAALTSPAGNARQQLQQDMPEWCSMQVCRPQLSCADLVAAPLVEEEGAAPSSSSSSRASPRCFRLAGGGRVLLVERPTQLPAALAALRSSMTDPVLAIDQEWRPDTVKGQSSPVALLQLGSATTALLVHTARFTSPKLPPALKELLLDPSITFLSCGWGTDDNRKMAATFEFDSRQLGGGRGVLEVQGVARALGYTHTGLALLGAHVLGLGPGAKRGRPRTSNWEARVLSGAQVRYAALDVLLVGEAFRTMKAWAEDAATAAVAAAAGGGASSGAACVLQAAAGSLPSLPHCRACGQVLGALAPAALRHAGRYPVAGAGRVRCDACGRWRAGAAEAASSTDSEGQ